MRATLKTAPARMPISLKEAKEHARIVLGNTDDDDYLDSLIEMATNAAEEYTRRRFITQTWYYYPECWPSGNKMALPFGGLQSVTNVKYKDTDGDESTMDAADYIVDTDAEPGTITLAYGESWPSIVLYPVRPITIEFICGYGDDGADVKPNIRHAIKLTVSNMYENRESMLIGQGFTLTQTKIVESLLSPYIVHGEF
jgi:uncharacterized phiE125 gp8 family phage protein